VYFAVISSIDAISAGVKGFVDVISKSAVINARASLPPTLVKFWISDLRKTIEPTPNAIHKKKNNSRLHDDRISRFVRLSMNFIGSFYRRYAKTQRKQ